MVSAPTLSTATPPSTSLTGGGDGVGDTIVLTITFDGVVNGLTSGTDNTIFKVAATGVSAVWGGITGTATRTLTYTVAAGQNGQATLDEVALKTALVAGISDAAGNVFAYSGTIADIDSTPLPVVSTVAAATSALVASPSLDNVTNLDVTSALAIAFDYYTIVVWVAAPALRHRTIAVPTVREFMLEGHEKVLSCRPITPTPLRTAIWT